ncbi:MAG: fatty acid desaturase [Leucothrix sp.]
MMTVLSPTAQPTPFTTATVEWPTIGLIIINWLAFLLLTAFYHALPWWIILPLGSYVLALFGSLQHEILHGHPTPKQWLNEALLFPNIALWLPYKLYQSTHLTHHINHQLTDPILDPESYYLHPKKWQRLPRWLQSYYRFYNTLLGRFFWGPLHIIGTLWVAEIRSVLAGDHQSIRNWGIHILACLPVLYWVVVICEIPLAAYLFLFVYLGISLTLLRAFIEHRAVAHSKERSIIVDTNPVMSLMYLNNNLHAIHHQEPQLAWYYLPAIWQAEREAVLAGNGNYYCSGYLNIILRYWNKAKEHPKYPLES